MNRRAINTYMSIITLNVNGLMGWKDRERDQRTAHTV